MACLYFANRYTAVDTWVALHIMHSLGYGVILMPVRMKEMKGWGGGPVNILCVCVCVYVCVCVFLGDHYGLSILNFPIPNVDFIFFNTSKM
jgi:hypothetical protein